MVRLDDNELNIHPEVAAALRHLRPQFVEEAVEPRIRTEQSDVAENLFVGFMEGAEVFVRILLWIFGAAVIFVAALLVVAILGWLYVLFATTPQQRQLGASQAPVGATVAHYQTYRPPRRARQQPAAPGGHTVETRVDAGDPLPDESHFFVAVCAHRPQIGNPTFVYVPRAANVLRERERHIALLDAEIAQKNQWLEKAQQDLAEFERKQRKLLDELEQSNQWADALNRELEERRARVDELQQELAREQENAQAQIRQLEQELAQKTEWARDLDATLARRSPKRNAPSTCCTKPRPIWRSHTAWAQRLEGEVTALREELQAGVSGPVGAVPGIALGQAGQEGQGSALNPTPVDMLFLKRLLRPLACKAKKAQDDAQLADPGSSTLPAETMPGDAPGCLG